MATNNFQLQGSYTRYEDGHHIGFDTIEGPNRRRNYKTLESAIRRAKNELKGGIDFLEFWHADAIRIVDRETQEVLWES